MQQKSTVKIFSKTQEMLGLGVLINNELVITCTHVITNNDGVLLDEVYATFPFGNTDNKFRAKLIRKTEINTSDISLLKFDCVVDADVEPAVFSKEENLLGHRFFAYGYPPDQKDGTYSQGIIYGKQDKDWIQIQNDQIRGFSVQPGFSGGGVYDSNLNAIVGIVNASDTNRGTGLAYMLSINHIHAIWPDLPLNISPTSESIKEKVVGNVFIASVTDDLNDKREELVEWYKDLGYKVFPENEQWLFQNNAKEIFENECTIAANEQKSTYIQLVSKVQGQPLPGNFSKAKFQYDIAIKYFNGRMFLWKPNSELSKNEDCNTLLSLAQERSFEEFKNDVTKTLEAPPPPPPPLMNRGLKPIYIYDKKENISPDILSIFNKYSIFGLYNTEDEVNNKQNIRICDYALIFDNTSTTAKKIFDFIGVNIDKISTNDKNIIGVCSVPPPRVKKFLINDIQLPNPGIIKMINGVDNRGTELDTFLKSINN